MSVTEVRKADRFKVYSRDASRKFSNERGCFKSIDDARTLTHEIASFEGLDTIIVELVTLYTRNGGPEESFVFRALKKA